MHMTTVNDELIRLLWACDAVFEYDPSRKLWCLRGPRGDLQSGRMPWTPKGEPWSTIEVPTISLQEAERGAIDALRCMLDMIHKAM